VAWRRRAAAAEQGRPVAALTGDKTNGKQGGKVVRDTPYIGAHQGTRRPIRRGVGRTGARSMPRRAPMARAHGRRCTLREAETGRWLGDRTVRAGPLRVNALIERRARERAGTVPKVVRGQGEGPATNRCARSGAVGSGDAGFACRAPVFGERAPTQDWGNFP
jgi:hypothetical protein